MTFEIGDKVWIATDEITSCGFLFKSGTIVDKLWDGFTKVDNWYAWIGEEHLYQTQEEAEEIGFQLLIGHIQKLEDRHNDLMKHFYELREQCINGSSTGNS